MTRMTASIAAVVLAITIAGCGSRSAPTQDPEPATATASRTGSSSDASLVTRDKGEQQFTRIEELIQARAPGMQVRIEVLKDTASTAFYGMRGGSGVILITTRKK